MEAKDVVPVKSGQLLTVGPAVILELLHTPGHSAGSMSVVVRKCDASAGAPASTAGTTAMGVMCGDTIFIGKGGRLDMPGGSEDDAYDAFVTLRQLDDELTVYPAHSIGGLTTTIGKEKTEGLLFEMSREEWKKLRQEGDPRTGSDAVAAAKARAEAAEAAAEAAAKA